MGVKANSVLTESEFASLLFQSSHFLRRTGVHPRIKVPGHASPENALANPLWGIPQIHDELPKLGIAIGQTSVFKHMARRRRPPSQGRRTQLRIHADGIAAMDLFVVPTISFRLLDGLHFHRNVREKFTR